MFFSILYKLFSHGTHVFPFVYTYFLVIHMLVELYEDLQLRDWPPYESIIDGKVFWVVFWDVVVLVGGGEHASIVCRDGELQRGCRKWHGARHGRCELLVGR